ncbi:MAG: MOSC domain-containing protein [Microcoleaceae cyanobacterium]
MNIRGVFIHPVKSCQRIALNQSEVTHNGLIWDREFMLVDRDNCFMTQRDYPQMAKIQVQLQGGTLIFSVAGSLPEPLSLEPNTTGQELAVKIWRDQTIAIDQGDPVADWFHRALNLRDDQACRLVRQSSSHARLVNPKYAVRETDTVSFADGYPLLLTNTASLDELNRRLQQTYSDLTSTVPMIRFRPNLVVETEQSFIEDNWRRIQVGTVQFDVVKPCDRCIVTTTDQATGERNPVKEPLKTLATFRKQSGGVMFGQNLIPRTTGIVRVGDPVVVL